jgi:formate C-acetyltransferase
MAKSYGFDISGPARNAREACSGSISRILQRSKSRTAPPCRWGARRLSRHLLRARPGEGTLTESQAQEIVDDFVMKLGLCASCARPSMTNYSQGSHVGHGIDCGDG